MSLIRVEGKKDSYTFNPSEKATVLKKGARGAVYVGKKASNGASVVIKEIKRRNPTLEELAATNRLSILSHSNIAGICELVQSGNTTFLITEYIEGVSLPYFIKEKIKSKEKAGFIIKAAAGALDGLSHLHEQGLAHADIRPSNLIVLPRTGKDEVQVKLIDLENIVEFYQNKAKASFGLIYSPPEQVLSFPSLVNSTTDIYATGISLYALLAEAPPFSHENPEILMHLMLTQPLPQTKKIPSALYEILKKATHKEPFPLPPARYSRIKLKEMIKKGQEKRHQKAGDLKSELLTCLKNL